MSASTTWNASINRHAGATLRLAAMVVGNVCGLPDDDECDPEKQRVMALAAKDEYDALVAALEARDSRAAELEAALLALVEAMPKCHVCYGTGTMPIRCTMCHDSTWDHECNDRNVPCTACSSSAAPLRAALLLLAKGGR